MTEVQLIGVMAAIIFAADTNGPTGKSASPDRAVEDPCDIYDQVVLMLGVDRPTSAQN